MKRFRPSSLKLTALLLATLGAAAVPPGASLAQNANASRSVTGSTSAADTTGRVARSQVGEVGQRQGRDSGLPTAGLGVRIASRIDNRIPLRLANRLDRNYQPRSNVGDTIGAATLQMRAKHR
jgi:hypothetical protein